jgi:hypothetical protein
MAARVNADPAGDASVSSIADLKRALRDDSFAPPPVNTVSRRAALASLAAVLPTTLLRVDDAQARKKNKKKRKKDKKPKNNAFGCLNVGKACNGKDDKCCSGICDGKKPKKGKKDKSRCIAHNVNSCDEAFDLCNGVGVACGLAGACFKTTGNAPFCAGGNGECGFCQRDVDCVNQGFGVGAACVVCNSECALISGGTVCFSAGG